MAIHGAGSGEAVPVVRASYYGRRENNVNGTVNGGGPELRITSHNATVRLHSK